MKTTILTAGALALAGLGAATAQAADVVKYGTVALKGDAGIVLMANEDQFDAKNGIDIQPTAMQGDALLLKALIAGQLDAYLGSPGGPMLAAAQGADVKILGCPWPGLTYALYTKPEITSIDQLKGGAIAVSGPGALPDLFARAAIMAAGMSQDDVKFVQAGSDADRVGAVKAGIVTAAPSSSEFQAKAPEMGLHMLVHAKDITPQYIRFCIISTGAKIKSEPEVLTNFLTAEIEAFTYALSHRDETLALSYKLNNTTADKDPSPAFIYDEVVADKAVDPAMAVDQSKLDWMRDLLAKTGKLPADFDVAKMVDTSLLDTAQKKAAAAE